MTPFVKQTFSFRFFHMLINAISLQFTFKDTNSHYTWFILKRQIFFLKSCSRITPQPRSDHSENGQEHFYYFYIYCSSAILVTAT